MAARAKWSACVASFAVPHPGPQIIPSGVEGHQRRDPQQTEAGERGDRNDVIACLAGNQETDRDQLHRGLPFCKFGHRHADPQCGEIFAQARYQNLAAQDHDRRPQRPAVNDAVRRQHQQAGRHQ